MCSKKQITIIEDSVEYTFIVNLSSRSVELVLAKPHGSQGDSIVSLHSLPDTVQIKFYRALNNLQKCK